MKEPRHDLTLVRFTSIRRQFRMFIKAHRAQIRTKAACTTETTAKEDDEDIRTFFENVEKPAVVLDKPVPLRWKKGHDPYGEEYESVVTNDDADALTTCECSAVETTPSYRGACKLFNQTISLATLETVLSPEENNVIKYYFENDFERVRANHKVISSLHKAITTLIYKLNNEVEINTDSEVKFLLTSIKGPQHLFDVMLFVPDYFPNAWGGQAIGLKISTDPTKASKLAKGYGTPPARQQPAQQVLVPRKSDEKEITTAGSCETAEKESKESKARSPSKRRRPACLPPESTTRLHSREAVNSQQSGQADIAKKSGSREPMASTPVKEYEVTTRTKVTKKTLRTTEKKTRERKVESRSKFKRTSKKVAIPKQHNIGISTANELSKERCRDQSKGSMEETGRTDDEEKTSNTVGPEKRWIKRSPGTAP